MIIYKTPRLVPLDMSKAHKSEHPDIDLNKTYLCLIGTDYFVGYFNRQWYGLNFHGWYGRGIQFNAPGYNASLWKQIWELIERV